MPLFQLVDKKKILALYVTFLKRDELPLAAFQEFCENWEMCQPIGRKKGYPTNQKIIVPSSQEFLQI